MITLLRKKQLSWHSIITAYIIGESTADFFEGLFNVILGLYRFPTHLSANPYLENEYGVILADFLILPFTFIIFTYYASKTKRPWLLSLIFAAVFITLEWTYLKLGHMKYIHWSLYISSTFYIAGFRFGVYLARRISSYDPPIPYRVRLLCFSHAILMWVSAMFALPIFKLYQFKPGLLKDYVADCRVAELLTGDFLSVLCVVFIPMIPRKFKPVAFTVITFIGVSIALIFYNKGWLVYHHWNHFFMATLRYLMPLILIMLYDRWESGYKPDKSTSPETMSLSSNGTL
jgi:hypothetical protein